MKILSRLLKGIFLKGTEGLYYMKAGNEGVVSNILSFVFVVRAL